MGRIIYASKESYDESKFREARDEYELERAINQGADIVLLEYTSYDALVPVNFK